MYTAGYLSPRTQSGIKAGLFHFTTGKTETCIESECLLGPVVERDGGNPLLVLAMGAGPQRKGYASYGIAERPRRGSGMLG